MDKIELSPYHLGSNEAEATHHLLLDRHTRTLSVAPQPVAVHLVQQQWPDLPAPPSSADLHPSMSDDGLVHAALAPSGGVYERYVAELCDWLDSHLGSSPSPSGAECVDKHTQVGDTRITNRQEALSAAEAWLRQRYHLDNPSFSVTPAVVEETVERWAVRVLIGSGAHVTLYVWPSGFIETVPLQQQSAAEH